MDSEFTFLFLKLLMGGPRALLISRIFLNQYMFRALIFYLCFTLGFISFLVPHLFSCQFTWDPQSESCNQRNFRVWLRVLGFIISFSFSLARYFSSLGVGLHATHLRDCVRKFHANFRFFIRFSASTLPEYLTWLSRNICMHILQCTDIYVYKS